MGLPARRRLRGGVPGALPVLSAGPAHHVADGGRGADTEAALATRGPHEELTRQVSAILRAQGTEVYGLSTESCAICAHCAWPDGPCRHPDRMFPCVESHGIVVTALAERHGIEFQYGGNVVTWFSLLLYRETPDPA